MHGPKNTVVIGLTGNIASGKTYVANIFREAGALVLDSDIVAHNLLDNECFTETARHFPNTVQNSKINRKVLAAEVFNDEVKLKLLESILHPKVREKNLEFIKNNPGKVIILEMPLLFETGAEAICDYVAWVFAPNLETQKSRAMKRPGMTEEKFAQIMEKQTRISERQKSSKSDLSFCTGEETNYHLKTRIPYLVEALPHAKQFINNLRTKIGVMPYYYDAGKKTGDQYFQLSEFVPDGFNYYLYIWGAGCIAQTLAEAKQRNDNLWLQDLEGTLTHFKNLEYDWL